MPPAACVELVREAAGTGLFGTIGWGFHWANRVCVMPRSISLTLAGLKDKRTNCYSCGFREGEHRVLHL